MKMIKKSLSRVKRKLFKPKVLKKIEIAGTATPRSRAFEEEGEAPVVYSAESLKSADEAFERLEKTWDAKFSQHFKPDHSVLIKINLNTADPYPASSAPEMVLALVNFLRRKKIKEIIVADCASNVALPTKKVAAAIGLIKALQGRASFIFFDQEPWVEVSVAGRYLEQVTVPKIALEVDRIINLANLKTHCLADFTFGMKLAVGFMHPLERYGLHRENLKEKTVEINLAVPADFTIIDGRTVFVTGGPSMGNTAAGNLVLFGADQLAVDLEAYKTLYRMKKDSGCIEGFREEPFEMAQLKHAQELHLGGRAFKGSIKVDI